MELSQQLTAARKAKGLTQEELADQARITVRTVQRIESGESTPRAFTLKTLAAVLDLPLDALLSPVNVTVVAPPLSTIPVAEPDREGARHFLTLLYLSSFSFLVIPYVHFLVPARVLRKKGGAFPPLVPPARKHIRGQVYWMVAFHLSLLLTLVYNYAQVRLGHRVLVLSYFWPVALFYAGNTLWILAQVVRVKGALPKTES